MLRLGAVETVGHTWLAALLQRIHADYPSITLQIYIDNTPDLRRAVIAHELDIATQDVPALKAADVRPIFGTQSRVPAAFVVNTIILIKIS